MQKLSVIIKPELCGKDVKTVLIRHMGISSSLVSKVKLREKGIMLNGQRVFTNAIVNTGDLLEFDISDESSPDIIPKIEYPLDIVFEDDNLIVINKPAPMVVYASFKVEGPCTVANALAFHWNDENYYLHAVNRLDRGTTGLMVVAKNSYVHEALCKDLHTDSFRREYRGITVGAPNPLCGEIDLPISREEGSKIKRKTDPSGAPAHTEYETLLSKNGFSLVRLKLKTGRTHQLRLHMSAIGTPLAGDFLYGVEDKSLISRPALHSYEMWLTHPVTQEQLHFIAPIPEDMQALIK